MDAGGVRVAGGWEKRGVVSGLQAWQQLIKGESCAEEV